MSIGQCGKVDGVFTTRAVFLGAAIALLPLAGAIGCGGARPGADPSPSTRVAAGHTPVGAEASSCPGHAPGKIAPRSWAAARTRLAPAGARAVLLCRYGPLPKTGLERSVFVSGPGEIARLVSDFNRLPLFPRRGVNCPFDDGTEVVAHLRYTGGRTVEIAVSLTGCGLVSNGTLTRSVSGFGGGHPYGPALRVALERLTGLTGSSGG